MSAGSPPPAQPDGREVRAAEPGDDGPVVLAEADDEDALARERALASTYDPLIAHAGKHDEQLIKERQEALLMTVDVAILAGVVIALQDDDTPEDDANDGDGGEAEPAEPDDDSLGD